MGIFLSQSDFRQVLKGGRERTPPEKAWREGGVRPPPIGLRGGSAVDPRRQEELPET